MPLKPIPRQSPPVVYVAPSRPRVQTIEKTSKPLKAFQAASVATFLLASVWLVMAVSRGYAGPLNVIALVAFAGGLAGYVVARVLTWWNHG